MSRLKMMQQIRSLACLVNARYVCKNPVLGIEESSCDLFYTNEFTIHTLVMNRAQFFIIIISCILYAGPPWQ